MAWRPWFVMICGGPETRHGPRGSGSFTRGRLGLGSSCLGFKRPCSSGLLLALVLMSIPVASGVVCNTCKDTITGCRGGTDCPLLKTPMANAASLDAGTSALAPDLTQLLPPELLCTFTKSVMETLSAVARAPKGGGPVDLSTGSLTSASDVVRAAINGFCTWEEAGLELAKRLGARRRTTAIIGGRISRSRALRQRWWGRITLTLLTTRPARAARFRFALVLCGLTRARAEAVAAVALGAAAVDAPAQPLLCLRLLRARVRTCDATVEDDFEVPANNPHGVPAEDPLGPTASSPPRLSPAQLDGGR